MTATPYLVAADLRADTLTEYTAQLALSDAEASTSALTAAIAAQSAQFDAWTNDHYDSETLTLDLTGSGSERLILPKRCTDATTVSIIDDIGTVTAQASTIYRLHSSLESGARRSESRFDYLSIIQTSAGLTGLPVGWNNVWRWPAQPGSVRVLGTFGWTTCPARVKRAVAILVYDQCKPFRADLRRARQWQDEKATMDVSQSEPSGLPEVDAIVTDYRRDLFGMG